MNWRLDPADCPLVFAPEYLRAFPQKGRAVHARQVGLVFHGLKDCLCLGRHSQVIAPEHDGRIPFVFRESCPYLGNEPNLVHEASQGLACDEIVELDEAVPLYPPGAANFWHWTTESLPKLLALESVGYDGPYIIPAHSAVAKASLAMHGITPGRILLSGPVYRVKRLLLPQRLSGFSLAENMPLTTLVREKLLEAVGVLPGGTRCYIRRIGIRKVANEPELLELLREYDFAIMTPEELPLAEQWRFMTNCDCSVMAHGANSTLSLLQKERSGFVELYNNRYVSYNNLHSVRLLRLRYHSIVEDLDLSSSPDAVTTVFDYLKSGPKADMLVDVTHVRIVLEGLLG